MTNKKNVNVDGQQQGKKKHKKTWIIVVVALVVIGIAFGAGSGSSSDNNGAPVDQTVEEAPIEYAEVTVDELYDALDANAINASEAYKGKYFAVTGKLSNIDSDGSYISLGEMNDEWSFSTVSCYIKSDEQFERVKQLSKGDIVTVRGKITSVGEVLGYSMDIDSID